MIKTRESINLSLAVLSKLTELVSTTFYMGHASTLTACPDLSGVSDLHYLMPFTPLTTTLATFYY